MRRVCFVSKQLLLHQGSEAMRLRVFCSGRAKNRPMSYRKSAEILEKSSSVVWGGVGAIFYVHLKKEVAQIIVLLHFGLATFTISFLEDPKTLHVHDFRSSRRAHDSKNIF